jgi:hypothetical protein
MCSREAFEQSVAGDCQLCKSSLSMHVPLGRNRNRGFDRRRGDHFSLPEQ